MVRTMSGSRASTDEHSPRGASARFGFTPVPEDEKQGMVNAVFARVARRYDLMNDLMSAGLHRLWKDDLVAWLNPPRGERPYTLIDIAGGTGDISHRVLRAAGAGAQCVICDISAEMLAAGRARAKGEERLRFVRGNAEALPLPDSSADACAIGFGIRNVTRLDAALAEAHRALRPGGRFLCLEFSEVAVPWLDALYDRYSFTAIPALGGLVAGDAASYRYLVESIREFPDQESFAGLIAAAGFERVTWRNLAGGIAAIHSGWKL